MFEMTQYFVTYNSKRQEYLVWNSQQVICRVSNITPKEENYQKVVEFLRQEYERTKEKLEIHSIASAVVDLEVIMKEIEGIAKILGRSL